MTDTSSRKQTQAEKAYQALRQRLLASSLKPGLRLNEYYWAQEFKVNRGDIRQALARLFADGLVEKGAKKGFLVRSYSTNDIKHLNETRFVLETAAAHLAVERATKQDIKRLKETCYLMRKMAENQCTLGLCETDVLFHNQFMEAAHNPKLVDVYQRASIPITALVLINGQTESQKLIQDTQQHEKITAALKKKQLKFLVSLLKQMLG